MSRARAEGGVAEWTHAGGAVNTRPTFTCCHCNNVTIVRTGARAEDCGGFCLRCMRPTCTACADKGCTPFEKQLETIEARGRLLGSVAGDVGR